MAKKKTKQPEPQETDQVAEEQPTGDTQAQMSEGVLGQMREEGVKLPVGGEAEPATEPEPEPEPAKTKKKTEQPTAEEKGEEGSTGGDDTDLKEEINALAEVARIDPRLLAGCESIEEAEKVAGAIREHLDQRAESTDDDSPSKPSEKEKTTAEDELNLEDLDEDEPVRKYIERLEKRYNDLESRLKESEQANTKRQEEQVQRAREQAAREFTRTLTSKNPELFGAPGNQTWSQKRRAQQAYDSAMMLDTAAALAGSPFQSIDQLAEKVLKTDFADEIKKHQQVAEANGRRSQRRLGGPSRRATTTTESSSAEDKADVDPREDPELFDIVRKVKQDHARTTASA